MEREKIHIGLSLFLSDSYIGNALIDLYILGQGYHDANK